MLTIVLGGRKILALQKPYFTMLSVHSRGELLLALAEGSQRVGDQEKARRYLLELVEINKEAQYGEAAQTWLANPQPTAPTCLGCHRE
jgi:hypothetical protein